MFLAASLLLLKVNPRCNYLVATGEFFLSFSSLDLEHPFSFYAWKNWNKSVDRFLWNKNIMTNKSCWSILCHQIKAQFLLQGLTTKIDSHKWRIAIATVYSIRLFPVMWQIEKNKDSFYQKSSTTERNFFRLLTPLLNFTDISINNFALEQLLFLSIAIRFLIQFYNFNACTYKIIRRERSICFTRPFCNPLRYLSKFKHICIASKNALNILLTFCYFPLFLYKASHIIYSFRTNLKISQWIISDFIFIP